MYKRLMIVWATILAFGVGYCAVTAETPVGPIDGKVLTQEIQKKLCAQADPDDYRIVRRDERWLTANPLNRLGAVFDSGGVRLLATADEQAARGTEEAARKSDALHMSLVRIGRQGAWRTAGAATIRQTDKRLEYHRADLPGVTEWYVNNASGLEQGIDLATRPDGTGELRVCLRIAGAGARAHGSYVRLETPAKRNLSLSALVVKDAAGHFVPAQFDVRSRQMVDFVIDDSAAVYPLVIDPLYGDEAWVTGFTLPG